MKVIGITAGQRSMTASVAIIAAVVACLLVVQASAARVDDDLKIKLVLPATKHQPSQGTAAVATAAATGGNAKKAAALKATVSKPAYCTAWRACADDYDKNPDLEFRPGMTDSSWPAFAADKCISTMQVLIGVPVTGTYNDATYAKLEEMGVWADVSVTDWVHLGWEAGCGDYHGVHTSRTG